MAEDAGCAALDDAGALAARSGPARLAGWRSFTEITRTQPISFSAHTLAHAAEHGRQQAGQWQLAFPVKGVWMVRMAGLGMELGRLQMLGKSPVTYIALTVSEIRKLPWQLVWACVRRHQETTTVK
jgi:hypothetical protein